MNILRNTYSLCALALLLLTGIGIVPAAQAEDGVADSYCLMQRDLIEVTVFDEPDLKTAQRIDTNGQVRLPLLGNFALAGKSTRDAEDAIEQAFIEREFLRGPQVTIRVIEYAPREISVLGCVGKPGNILLPAEEQALDIVEVISRAGDFTRIANRGAVVVRRRNSSGEFETVEINVADIVIGKGNRNAFPVYPGDVVFVPERLF